MDSGAFAGDNPLEPVRPGGVFVVGQDQDALDGDYNKLQSWSGLITQHNLWNFSIEEYDIENFAECRSDAFGNVVKYKMYNRVHKKRINLNKKHYSV